MAGSPVEEVERPDSRSPKALGFQLQYWLQHFGPVSGHISVCPASFSPITVTCPGTNVRRLELELDKVAFSSLKPSKILLTDLHPSK